MDHLSNLDASFLHFETPETPMHVGSLMLLELPEGYDGDFYEDFKAMVGDRMHLASVLRRKLAPMPFELAEPVWIDDDDIDLDYHVRSQVLRRPGSMKQLEMLVARLHSTLLDRSRPLWEIFVIEGLENGQVAVYTKAHHSGVDGKAGTELAKVMYDLTPEIREVPPPRRKRHTRGNNYQLGVAELLQAALKNATSQYQKLGQTLPQISRALTTASRVIAEQRPQTGERSLNLGLAPRTIFNDSITNQRSFSTLSLPFGELKALGKRVGGTVNTVVMAMCASALRRFLLDRDLLPKQSLIAMVPVSLRDKDDDSMNNQVSAVRVDLATDIADPAERFKAIHASSEAAKAVVRELQPVLRLDTPIQGSPWFMTGLASLYGRSNLASRMPAVSNVLISNVPGPATTLYVAGAKMLSFYPVSIPYHGAALNMTVQSYAGTLEFGLTACRRILSQDESYELVELLKVALREIEAMPSVDEADAAKADAPKADEAPGKAKTGKAAKAAKADAASTNGADATTAADDAAPAADALAQAAGNALPAPAKPASLDG
jgi:diacylglycerol O-acyltransferase